MDTPLSSSEQSYSQTLSTIPRASNPSLSSSLVIMGDSITVYTNRASSNFTHVLYYQIGSGGWNTIATEIGTNKSWTVPLSLANSTPNSTNLNAHITEAHILASIVPLLLLMFRQILCRQLIRLIYPKLFPKFMHSLGHTFREILKFQVVFQRAEVIQARLNPIR